MRSWIADLLALGFVPAVRAQTKRVFVVSGPAPGMSNIWVLQKDNRLARYDSTQFRLWQTIGIPPQARKHPEGISISRAGDVRFAFAPRGDTSLLRLWCANPLHAPELLAGAEEKRPAPDGGYLTLSATPEIYFSGDGSSLYWFEDRQERLSRGADIWTGDSFLAWSTDSRGDNPKLLVHFAFPRCACGTGACEETCPRVDAWAPATGVSDFFFLTRWVPGQLSSDYLETSVYQRSNGVWTARKLPHPVERLLDAADHGNTFVEAVPDAGCCSWENESDDTTSVFRGAVAQVMFDERARFHNKDYDVSFFTSKAALSPDVTRVAYTLNATAIPGRQIRLSSEGKENSEELLRLQKAIAELPRVEVVALSDTARVVISLAKAELIGWLDNRRLLILKDGQLQVIEAATGGITPTGIKPDGPSFVFLR
jgi:hypothetical protein